MQGPVSGRRISRRMVRTIIIIGCSLLLIAAAVVGGMMFMNKLAENRQQEKQADLESVTGDVAAGIAQAVSSRIKQAQKLAASPELIEQFRTADKAALDNYAEGLADKIPSAIKIRLFLPGEYSVDRESRPPMGYASLDLLRAAESGKGPIPVEIHNSGNEDAHVVLVQRVTDQSGTLLGLVHVSLNPAAYIKIDQYAADTDGYMELVQQAGGAPLVLSSHGDGKFKQGSPITSRINGTRWQIRYWPANTFLTVSDSSGGGFPFMTVAVIMLVLLIGAYLLLRMRGSSGSKGKEDTDNSSVVFAGAIKAIQDGLHPGLEKLLPNIPGLGQKKPVEPVSQGMEGEDITRVIKPSDVAKKMAQSPAKKPDSGIKVSTAEPAV
ncbi:MAG TPA: hypothetical protein VJ981_04930, partial [Gammaproteobacteria bacterium]|nr:hypothetical protein [Gammaproteobacteria bacterium]